MKEVLRVVRGSAIKGTNANELNQYKVGLKDR